MIWLLCLRNTFSLRKKMKFIVKDFAWRLNLPFTTIQSSCFVFLLLNASQVRAYWWLCMSWKRRLIIHVLYMIRVDAVRLWDAVEAQIRVGRVPLPSCWINIRCFQVTLKSSDFLGHTSNNRNDTYCSGLWDNPHRRLVQSNKRVNVSSHCACGWCWCCGVLLPANAS